VIVLVHAGVCDARMWDGFDLPGAIPHELRGFGQTPPPPTGEFSHADDLEEALGGEPAVLVGSSYGGWVCLEVAARSPELVTELVLLGAPLFDTESWSDEIEAFGREEESLLEQGDLHGAAILNADFWLESDEPRERVIEMQERAFQLDAESEAEPVQAESVDLGAITARTLVAVGELDKRDFHEMAGRLTAEIPDTEHVVIEGAGHLPSLDRPEHTARIVREFLG
jgi:pimeloyl-ACP methyl ester carboxylesterase